MDEVESTHELEFPHREAAFFYGLFLRGFSADQLRRDIEVPPDVQAKWNREAEREPEQRGRFYRIMEFRRSVLAIFDSLVTHDENTQLLQ